MSTPEKKPNQMHAHHGASNEKPARTSVPTRRRSQVAEVEIGAAEEGGHFVGMQTREYSGWDVYNNEAKKVDTELVNDWRDSLNSLLLFVSHEIAEGLGFHLLTGRHLCCCSHRLHHREQEDA